MGINMRWNIDFEVTAMLFEVVFLFFFAIKRHLPTKQNQYFKIAMAITFFTSLFDILSAIISSYPNLFPLPIMHGINVLFFCLIPMLALSFLIYILSVTRQLEIMKTPLFVVYCIPFIIVELLSISSPLTGLMYWFDANNMYHQGSGYYLVLFFDIFYLGLAFIYVTAYRRNVRRAQLMSIYTFAVMIVIGAFLQSFLFRWVLITFAVTPMALIIVYLSLENPDIYIDKETGLFNSNAFVELTMESIREKHPFSIITISIDEYRTLNSLYGMEVISRGMSQIADYLKRTFPQAIIFHFTSDRFVIEDKSDMDFYELERIIRNRFERTFTIGETAIQFHVSLTYLSYQQIENNLGEIYNIISFSMEHVNHMGNDSTIIIDERVLDRMNRDIAVERAIEKAIKNNSIQMYYQPIYSVKEKRINSCEALARLFDDDIGFIPPYEFIAKAEENGSIIQLGKQIFEKVMSFMKDNDLRHYGIDMVSINLSPIQCMQTNLAEELIDSAKKFSVSMDRINLEITETATMDTKQIIKKNMKKLVEVGVTFSLDDYGTGFSNLASILELPFEYVKIDKSLVWTYFENVNNVLPDLIHMFESQKLQIVVEGVENEEMLESVSKMGDVLIQGFCFSKPVPAIDFFGFVREMMRTT